MKFNFKKAVLLFSGVLAGGLLFAQTPDTTKTSQTFNNYVKPFSPESAFRTWSIGINVGVLTPYNIIQDKRSMDFTSPDGQLGYSAYIKKQILSSFGIQADFMAGKLKGDHAQLNRFGFMPYETFSTKLNWSASLSGNLTLANINWRHKQGFIQPYVTLGAGLMGYTPTLISRTGEAATNFKPDNGGHIKELFIPVGTGVKFNLSPGINLDLGYQINFVNSDNVDGYDYGSGNDRFSYAHIGLEFALGKGSKPQLATHNPVNSMRAEYLTEEDRLKNSIQAQQAQIDAEKAQNDKLRADLDATNANLAKFTVDSDGDGVPDFFDKCPNTPTGTKVDGSGCPLPVAKDVKVYVTEEDRKIVREAIKNLEFDFGKATIREHSYPSLDRVAQLLIDKNFSLKLAGHTDNVGSADANMKLSKDRAESIKAYLVSKGANASRIEATGY
ncbi:MAG TPA: OmpA family protein, partial [Mucilaginibacter sp.]|nr:OmpA family protein [Mucilaginibacter sp.]